MNFISNIISNSVAGFVEAGTRTAGGYAGDAIIRAGDLIESTGRGVGTSVENAATSYGDKLKGQGTITTTKAYLPKTPTPKTKAITSGKTSVTHPTTLQRSCSSPASSQAKKTAIITSKGAGAASKPGSNPSTGKQTALKKPTPYASTSTNVPKSNSTKPKPYPGTTAYPSKVDSSKSKHYPSTASNPSRTYASSASNPKPYPGTTTYPNSGKKTAVKPAKKPATPAKTEEAFRHI